RYRLWAEGVSARGVSGDAVFRRAASLPAGTRAARWVRHRLCRGGRSPAPFRRIELRLLRPALDRDHGSRRRVVADPPQEGDACCQRGAVMLIQYGQALGDYLYDVFVAKFDFWLLFGLIAQLFFTARFLVQWIASERAGNSVVPMAFWFCSMGGG